MAFQLIELIKPYFENYFTDVFVPDAILLSILFFFIMVAANYLDPLLKKDTA